MALEFLSDATVEDAELVIRLDLDGLHTLLKAMTTALEARLEQPTLEGGDGCATASSDAWNAFGKVTVRFVDAARSDLGGQLEICLAGGARGSGDTACWEIRRHGT